MLSVVSCCVSVVFCSSSDNSSVVCIFFFFQAEDGIRYLVRSRGLGDVYKRQLDPQTLGNVARTPLGLDARRYDLLEPGHGVQIQGLSLIHI
mgnify:CR=1 FL=1